MEIYTTKILIENGGVIHKTIPQLCDIVKGVGSITGRTLLVHHVVTNGSSLYKNNVLHPSEKILVIIGDIGNATDKLLYELGTARIMEDDEYVKWKDKNKFDLHEKCVF